MNIMDLSPEFILSVLVFAGGVIGIYVKLSTKIANLETQLHHIRKDMDRERSNSEFGTDKLTLISENLAELRVLVKERISGIEAVLARHERELIYLSHKKLKEDGKD